MLLDISSKNKVSVKGRINYIHADTSTVFDLTTQDKSPDTLTNEIDEHTVEIINARTLNNLPMLNEQGFTLAQNTYVVSNYFDEKSIVTELHPQVIAHLLAMTGAATGIVFDHTIRSVEDNVNKESDQSEKRSPVQTVHNDYTEKSAENRLRIELEKEGISAGSFSKYQFINTWIPLVDEVVDSPLAFADSTTFSAQDSHLMQVAYPNRMGEIEAFSFNENHQWYFFPNMTSKEQLNFKVFDSEQTSLIKRVPHSAFTTPNHDIRAPKRISIEVRSIVLFV